MTADIGREGEVIDMKLTRENVSPSGQLAINLDHFGFGIWTGLGRLRR